MKFKQIADIDTVLKIYYSFTEISSKEIKSIFGSISDSTARKYKREVKKEQINQKICTNSSNTVDTKTAFKVFGIDVDDLEMRRAKLIKLGL